MDYIGETRPESVVTKILTGRQSCFILICVFFSVFKKKKNGDDTSLFIIVFIIVAAFFLSNMKTVF